ncbi:MAG: hypothetical protein ACRCZI_00615, partial [Cetobacterium sp.]
TLKAEDIIKDIYNLKNAKSILRKSQTLNKHQNIFYMLFLLAKDEHFILSKASQYLDITTRNLNNYLKDVKESISFFYLDLEVTNKGIFLKGEFENIIRFKFFCYFKFLIEKDYLPKNLRNEFLNFSKIEDFNRVKKDIKKLFELIKPQNILYTELLFFSLYIVYKDHPNQNSIKNCSIDKAIKYKPNSLSNDEFIKTFHFLQNSIFKDVYLEKLSTIFVDNNNFYYSKNYFSSDIIKYTELISRIFKKYLGETTNSFFPEILKSFIFYCEVKQSLFFDDPSFINLNLRNINNSNFIQLKNEIQGIIPSFSFFENITLWYLYTKKAEVKENNIFVFKYLNDDIIRSLVEEIYKKHNIKINTFMNIKNLNTYLNENHVDNIIIIENIKLYVTNISIKNLFLPISNFKKQI